jgi:hypothetical protein
MDETIFLMFLFIATPVIAVFTALFFLIDNVTGKVGEASAKAEKERQNE